MLATDRGHPLLILRWDLWGTESLDLVSPDHFDLSKPVTVVVNGRTAYEGSVQKDLRALLKWSARDNDRTMLFASELAINVR